jgi:hypothetical protein
MEHVVASGTCVETRPCEMNWVCVGAEAALSDDGDM